MFTEMNILSSSQRQNAKNASVTKIMEKWIGILLQEIDGRYKKNTELKLSTVCGQVLKHVKKSYRTLNLSFIW